MISTPFVAVPPPRYGGTELVVWELLRGLQARGHEVVLFATGDSSGSGPVASLFEEAVWPPDRLTELLHASWAAEVIARDLRGFDVVHAHVPTLLPLAGLLPAPVVYTVHHDRHERLAGFYARVPGPVRFVGISRRQVRLYPEIEFAAVVHHGLDPARYPAGAGGDHLAFLGRLSPVKGPDTAMDVAAALAMPLRVGGVPHDEDAAFHRDEVLPRVRPGVELLGELGHEAKVRLLGGARALLFPVRWDEPFGLVMIESMLCGTPVVAFPGGAVAEVVEPGVTGFIAGDAADMARLVRDAVPRLSRERVRARAVERFATGRMVEDYLDVYGAPRLRPTWGHA